MSGWKKAFQLLEFEIYSVLRKLTSVNLQPFIYLIFCSLLNADRTQKMYTAAKSLSLCCLLLQSTSEALTINAMKVDSLIKIQIRTLFCVSGSKEILALAWA